MLLSYGEDLDYEIYCMQQSYLEDPEFNDSPGSGAGWYNNCSCEIEVVARVIFDESSLVMNDQNAVACVVKNRAVSSNKTPYEVVIQPEQFSSTEQGTNNTSMDFRGSYLPMWANAVYLSCLMSETLNDYDWNSISAIPSGFGSQKNFRSGKPNKLGEFANSSSGGMTHQGTSIKNVWMSGYGTITSKEMLNIAVSQYPNQNVFFAYWYEY